MRYILLSRLFKNKQIVTLTLLLSFLVLQVQAQQQIISFPDPYVRAALLAQYGEGATGLGNGAVLTNATTIDFSKLYSQSNPTNRGVNGVTSLVVYPNNYVPGTLTGVELLSGLTDLTVNGYNGLQLPTGIVNLPLKTLDLSINSITTLPANLSNFPLLESLNISQNTLNSLPFLPSSLTHLVADHNNLSFQDLEPYVGLFSNALDYAEQMVFEILPGAIDLTAGQTLSATAAGYVDGVNNRYQWFKDGQKVSSVSTDPSLTISSMRAGDAGTYTCQVTNTLLEGLIIHSGFLVVSVTPSPLLNSDQLWGMTSRTGSTTGGGIFKIDASSNAVSTIKQLTSTDGTFPNGDLMQASDGFLYGMTYLDGASNMGTIFRIYKDGTQFQKLYDFENTLGNHPKGTLVEATDGNLYGMTERGPGEILTGTVFRISKGVSPNYTHLYEFPYQALPLGNLIQADDDDLYGMTQTGAVGGGNMGTIFKIKTDGSAFKVLHQFDETKLEGHQPNGSLYGMTVHGGENVQGDGGGTLFRMETDGRGFKMLLKLLDGPKGSLIQGADGNLYGMTQGGSFNLYGSVFKTDLNGTNLQTIHEFNNLDGAYPSGSLTEAPNGEMYGMTLRGGVNDKGVLFKIRPDGSNFNKLHDFDATGYGPIGTLLFARKINQTITFARIPDKQIIDGSFALTASSTSGLAVTLTSSDPSVASIAGNMVTLNAIGSATITASQEGDTNFDAAKSVLRVLNVTGIKQNQTITFNPLAAKIANDENFQLTAFSDSGLPVSYTSSDESVATIFGSTVTIRAAGTTTITASQPGNNVYFIAEEVTQPLVISKADQLITFNALPAKNKRSPSFTLNASASSQLPVTYASSNPAVATIAGNVVTIMSAGTTTISANQLGNYSYHPAAMAQQELLVDKAAQTIHFEPIDLPLAGDGTFTLEAFSDSDLTITYSSSDESVATVSGDMLTVKGNGTTIITASQAGSNDYLPAAAATQGLTIDRQDQSITFNALPVLNIKMISYALSAAASSGLPVAYISSNPNVATVSGRKVTIVGKGSTIITATQKGNGRFNPASAVEQELVVAKADQTITFHSIDTKVMEEEVFGLDATSGSSLEINFTSADDEITINGSTITLLKPGFVTITAHQQGDADFNAAAPVTQSFCIAPATPVITSSFADPDAPVLTSSSATGNQWYKDGALINNATHATYTVDQEGEYTVRVAAESCSSIISEPAIVLVTELKQESKSSVLVSYPNPATESITLSMEVPLGTSPRITIRNSMGAVVQRGGNELLNQAIAIDHYVAGVYIASIRIGDKIVSRKFVKK